MFTGIIEEIGMIRKIKKTDLGVNIEISAKKVLENTQLGDSIAVNGVCLTATQLLNKSFAANIMNESLKVTNLNNLSIGDKVNLERALTLEMRLGGHLMAGHIDTVGKVKRIHSDGFSKVFEIAYNNEYSKYLIYKGSIAINGISLTVSDLKDETFSVSIIPHSITNTNLQYLNVGGEINLEFDMIGKYIYRFNEVENPKEDKKNITKDFLTLNGFI